MKTYKNIITIAAAVLVIISVFSGCMSIHGSNRLNPEKTWVVLVEKDYYPAGYADLNIDFENSKRLMKLFGSLGVPDENILFIKNDVGEQQIRESFEWLAENADEDATIFYYMAAHGSYIRKRLRWNFLTPPQWNSLPQSNKIMVVDSCNAGEFISRFEESEESGITYGVVASDELNWWGEESEGLPIIGSIWVNYFIEAFENPAADQNGDGALSFTEAHCYTNAAVQQYTKENIFGNEDYLNSYIRYGYDPVTKPAYPNAAMNNHLEKELILYRYGIE